MTNVRKTRRRYLESIVASAGVVAVAGCVGDGDGDDGDDAASSSGGGNGNEGDSILSPRTHDAFDDPTVNEEEAPLFYANPDVEGPGGDAEYVMHLGLRDFAETDEFETFIVEFESTTLHRDSDSDVEVPVEVTVDLLESLEEGESFVLAHGLAIPTGTYTGVSYHVTAIELVHEDDGDVTEYFEQPETAEYTPPEDRGADPVDVGSGAQWSTLQSQVTLEYTEYIPEVTFTGTSLGCSVWG